MIVTLVDKLLDSIVWTDDEPAEKILSELDKNDFAAWEQSDELISVVIGDIPMT